MELRQEGDDFVQIGDIDILNKKTGSDVAVQNRTWLSVEDAFPEGAVIMAGDPMPDMSVEGMRTVIQEIHTTQELVDAYVQAHNKFWYIEDDLYDYEEGTDKYIEVKAVVDAWGDMMDSLCKRVMDVAKQEGLLAERQPDSGTIKQLEEFMKKYGYRDGCGWWVEIED